VLSHSKLVNSLHIPVLCSMRCTVEPDPDLVACGALERHCTVGGTLTNFLKQGPLSCNDYVDDNSCR
jgi:hypothetical protein